MKWTVRDIGSYFQEKEYVDTAVVPLIRVTWHREIKSTVEQGEYTALMADQLERQLKGRLVQFPPLTYLSSEPLSARVARLNEWKKVILQDGMKHVFFLTSDTEWKTVESEQDDSLIWIPSLPLEHMDPDNSNEILGAQTTQLLQIIMGKWQNA
ncbi:MAG TPA: YpiF family protein [Bacillales bacterium]|nr:YpiF family protein [Bacillales bacterium]